MIAVLFQSSGDPYGVSLWGPTVAMAVLVIANTIQQIIQKRITEKKVAVAAVEVKEALSVAATEVKGALSTAAVEVKDALSVNTVQSDDKINQVLKIANETKIVTDKTHKVMNSEHGTALKVAYEALQRVAELTKNARDIANADTALDKLEKHEKAQAEEEINNQGGNGK